MFKKLVIATAVFAATTTVALAGHHSYKGERDLKGEMPCPVNAFMAAPYIGVEIGPRATLSGGPTAFGGFDGILSLGYAAMLNPSWYLAGEIFGLGTINVKNGTNTNATGMLTSSKNNWSWGGSLIPGFLLTDTVLGTLRLGGQQTHFNDISKSQWGWSIGPGLQTNLNQNWDLRAEYVFTYYGNVSPNGNTARGVPDGCRFANGGPGDVSG